MLTRLMRVACLIVMVVLVLPSAPAALGQGAYPLRYDPFINDYAALLSTDDAAAVHAQLSDLKSARGIEAVVVTINSIGDYGTGDATIESFATHLFNTWGIGDATRNDGVLLLVAVKDHKVRIELGSGYGSGPSSEMQAVIDRYVLPKFRANAYSSGILIGTQAMIAKLTDQPMPETGDIAPTLAPFVSTNYAAPSASPAAPQDNSGLIALVGLVAAWLCLYAIGKAFGGQDSSNQSDDDDDGHSSSWRSTSSSSSSYHSSSSSSSSSHRSSGSSSGGGGRSSGGGASGSW